METHLCILVAHHFLERVKERSPQSSAIHQEEKSNLRKDRDGRLVTACLENGGRCFRVEIGPAVVRRDMRYLRLVTWIPPLHLELGGLDVIWGKVGQRCVILIPKFNVRKRGAISIVKIPFI